MLAGHALNKPINKTCDCAKTAFAGLLAKEQVNAPVPYGKRGAA